MKFAVGLGLFFGSVALAIADCDIREVQVSKDQDSFTTELVARSDYLLDYTVTLYAVFLNMEPSRSLPVTVDVTGEKTVKLITLRIKNRDNSWHYQYTFHYQYGARGGIPDNRVVYLLPYPPAERHKLVRKPVLEPGQKNVGKLSHFTGSGNGYTYDWSMPVGTKVCAAREGVIVGVRQDSDSGGFSSDYSKCSNFIIIRHSDGTYAEYLNLKKNGALVALGDRVKAGQTIGLSGATGFLAEGSQLSFSVFRPVDGIDRESLPITIKTMAATEPSPTDGDQGVAPHVMPTTNIECRVFDDVTNKPILGAELFMCYLGPNAGDKTIRRGPFLTDASGDGHVTVASDVVWETASGGYVRQVEVRAVGYEEAARGEGSHSGLLDKESLIFKLKKTANPQKAKQSESGRSETVMP